MKYKYTITVVSPWMNTPAWWRNYLEKNFLFGEKTGVVRYRLLQEEIDVEIKDKWTMLSFKSEKEFMFFVLRWS